MSASVCLESRDRSGRWHHRSAVSQPYTIRSGADPAFTDPVAAAVAVRFQKSKQLAVMRLIIETSLPVILLNNGIIPRVHAPLYRTAIVSNKLSQQRLTILHDTRLVRQLRLIGLILKTVEF